MKNEDKHTGYTHTAIMQGGACSSQCCQNFRVPNHGKLAFLPVASDFKVAQFLSSNHTPISKLLLSSTQLG